MSLDHFSLVIGKSVDTPDLDKSTFPRVKKKICLYIAGKEKQIRAGRCVCFYSRLIQMTSKSFH